MASLEVLFDMYMYRESNVVVDPLSKYKLCFDLRVEYFEQPPPHVFEFFLDDLCELLGR